MAWGDLYSPTAETPDSSKGSGGLFLSSALPRGRAVDILSILLTGIFLATSHPGDSGDPQALASAWPGTSPSWAGLLLFRTKATGLEGNEGGRGSETLTRLEGCLGGRKCKKTWFKAVGKASKTKLASLRVQGHKDLTLATQPGLWTGGLGRGSWLGHTVRD